MGENKGIAIGQASGNVFWAGHVFQECEGINRCIHCGQTLKNFVRCSKREEKFWTFGNSCVLPEANCLIPEAGRFPEPSAEDNFAVFFWHSSGRKFFGARKERLTSSPRKQQRAGSGSGHCRFLRYLQCRTAAPTFLVSGSTYASSVRSGRLAA